MRNLTLMLLSLLVLATGCASLAPERTRPDLPVPDAWPGSTQSGNQTGLKWTAVFPDPALQALITTALSENRSLRQTILAIDQSRAAARLAGAARVPHLSATGSETVKRSPADIRGGQAGIDRTWSTGLSISAFEIDLYGRLKNLEDAALEEYLASEEARRAVEISLVSQVAATYLTLAGDREALTLAKETLASRQDSLAVIRIQVENGVDTELTLQQADEAVAVAQSEVARLTARIQVDINALALLTGTPANNLNLPAGRIADVRIAETVTPGLPSELLTRRPDVMEAEHMLWAAGARVGAARAAFFPSISLTSTAGLSSLQLTDLFDITQRVWTFVPTLNLPIFDGGTNKANLESAEAAHKIRIAAYEQAIQTAFSEVADALALQAGYAGQVQAQTRREKAAAHSRDLVNQRFEGGLESALTLHDAERTLFTARQDLLSARLAEKQNIITLFTAMGGGWDTAPAGTAQP